MALVAAKILIGYGVDGSITMHDVEIERRPYHRNCSCALHKKGPFSNICSQHGKISFPKKKSWNDCSLFVGASKLSAQSSCLNDTSFRNSVDTDKALSSRWQKVLPCLLKDPNIVWAAPMCFDLRYLLLPTETNPLDYVNGKRSRVLNDGVPSKKKKLSDLSAVLPAGFLDPLPVKVPPAASDTQPAANVNGIGIGGGGKGCKQFWKARDFEGTTGGDWDMSTGKQLQVDVQREGAN
ncbi:hypothetical protein LguiA_011155 [Lonicera macranthoides]